MFFMPGGAEAEEAARKAKENAWEEFWFKLKFGATYCAVISILPFFVRWFQGGKALKD
eukprot:CAMPEP_0181495042 /NCGR_PEP_ID=MMETSP1110-20121109/52157_1 /TAXON_ID=174948 /ORGANISM="Symbiodinium sp., Strain CCMP421" /LENGTH=57 /DNA_ID=CAMNT_0023622621 /DNA_START=1 /DNA_END=174 /DNA_ORIENTATION=-